VDYLLKEREIMTNGMIKLELLGGTKSEQEFERLKNRLDALDIIDINTRLWEEAYSLSFKLRRKGLSSLICCQGAHWRYYLRVTENC